MWRKWIQHKISALEEKLARRKAQSKGEPPVAARLSSRSGEGGKLPVPRRKLLPISRFQPQVDLSIGLVIDHPVARMVTDSQEWSR